MIKPPIARGLCVAETRGSLLHRGRGASHLKQCHCASGMLTGLSQFRQNQNVRMMIQMD